MLKRRALLATAWSGADIFLRQGLQFAITMVLARLLSPGDFGVIALVALFNAVATAVVDGGFSVALIQNQKVDRVDESTVFWFNMVIGASLAVIFCAIAPKVAEFYAQPVLKPLLRLMAVNVVFISLGAIHRVLLSKQLNFRSQMQIGVLSVVLSGGLAIMMAVAGYGVWALAGQIVAMTVATTTLLWLLNNWRPLFIWSPASARRLFGFGGYHLGANLLDVIYQRLYALMIGKLYNTRLLGFYNNADSVSQLPAGFLVGVLARVALPMFSEVSGDKAKLRRGVQLSIRGMMLLNAPMMLGMAALAEPVIRALLGDKWLASVPIFRVLCLAGLLLPIHAININVLMAQGHSRLMLRLELVKKILGVSLVGVGALMGVMGIAWSQVVFSVLAFYINAHYSRRFLDYGAVAQLVDFLPTFVFATLMAAPIYFISERWLVSPLIKLAVFVPLGAAFYFAIAYLLRLKAVHDVVALLSIRSARSSELYDSR